MYFNIPTHDIFICRRIFLIGLQITGKVFAKGGLNLTERSISTGRSKLLFQITKLQKSNMKSKLRLSATDSSIITSTPPFANTMLCAVVFYISNTLLTNLYACFSPDCGLIQSSISLGIEIIKYAFSMSTSFSFILS